jgi:hypothetical protein
MKFIGKNEDFIAIFNAYCQMYSVYYKGNWLINKYKFVDIESYLN